jgi:Tol biopolymer transport system component
MNDQSGRSSLWVAPTNRRSSPVRISSTAIEDSPFFLPDGDLIFRAVEGGSNFLYRMKVDGSGRRKITSEPVIDAVALSPDGRWLIAATAAPSEEHSAVAKAFAIDGSEAVTLCLGYCMITWDNTGKFVFVYFSQFSEKSYVLPVQQDSGLPLLPRTGIERVEDFTNVKGSKTVTVRVDSAVSSSVYAYTAQNTRRNLYRVPLP